ncbi:MAG: sigma-70 family RNA polymerase sigma factor [Acidobacteriota bacterium]
MRETLQDDKQEAAAIEAVRGGDGEAYEYLVQKYLRRTVAAAWQIVRDRTDAEDLAQEAFVKAFEKIDRFRAGERFAPWIYRIVTNLSLDLVKHRRRVRPQELSDDLPSGRNDHADRRAQSNEIAMRIDEALGELPEMQRVVARLYLIEEFSHTEIAGMTGISEGTVRSHLSHARRKLQDRLHDLMGGGH